MITNIYLFHVNKTIIQIWQHWHAHVERGEKKFPEVQVRNLKKKQLTATILNSSSSRGEDFSRTWTHLTHNFGQFHERTCHFVEE